MSTSDRASRLNVAAAAGRLSVAGVPATVVHDPRQAPVPGWRGRLAIASLAAAAIALAASPIAAARLSAASASSALREITGAYREAAARESELQRIARLIGAVDSVGSGPNVALRLASITRALPVDAALVAVTVDSVGASLVVVADEMMRVVASLDSLGAVDGVRTLGPITQERLSGRDLQRATIRFSWRAFR